MSSNSKSMSDFLTEVSMLNNEILDFELIARGITPARGPLINKRRQLASALLKEANGQIFFPYFQFDPIVDLRNCAAIITALKIDFENPVTPNDRKQKITTNLKFIDARLGRIICTNNEEKWLAKDLTRTVKQLLLTDIINLNESNTSSNSVDSSTASNLPQINSNINPIPSTSAHNNNFEKEPIERPPYVQPHVHINPKTRVCADPYEIENAMASFHFQSTPNHYNAPFEFNNQINNQTFKLPVHKWKIRFSGLNDKKDAFEFLRIIKSKANSYNTTHDELMASASEFFIDDASRWYFSQKFDDWSDLEAKLIADFMQVNYFDDLIDTIRQTKQSSNESIVQFCPKFEDNCSRLKTLLSTQEKINILKRNILYKYQPYIALTQFQNLNELKHALKLLEATMSHNNYGFNRNVRFNSRERSVDRHEKRFNSRERQSYSPYRKDSNSRFSNDNSKSYNANNYRSSRDRNRSPYPSHSNRSDSHNSNNNNNSRDRSNSNSNRSRDNSRENFRTRSRENSTNRNNQS